MIWEHVVLPLFYQWQRCRLHDFLQRTLEKNVPILKKSGLLDLVQWRSEQNCWQLKQKRNSQTWQQNHHQLWFAVTRKFN